MDPQKSVARLKEIIESVQCLFNGLFIKYNEENYSQKTLKHNFNIILNKKEYMNLKNTILYFHDEFESNSSLYIDINIF